MLRSTFYGFNIAASGMFTAQKALDLTGNNMTNINTVGYTRQRLDLNSIPSANYTDRYAPFNNVAIGQGVNVTRVAQFRDPFLDRRFRNEASAVGELDAHLSVMSEISRIFDQVQFNEGLFKSIQDFRSQLQRYSPQTGEITLDATVASSADSMLKMFQMYAVQINNVREYQDSLLNGHGGAVPEINKMLENLAVLNESIWECDIYGNPALEMRDQRNLILDQLSAYMKIEVSYYPDPNKVLASRGVEICKVEFIADNTNSPSFPNNWRTLVDGSQNATIGVDQVTDPITRNITTQIFRKTGLDGNPIIDGTGMPLYYNGSNPNGSNPVLDKDGKHMTDSLGEKLYYTPEDPSDPTASLADIDFLSLQFTTGALKGALDMLNSKGPFDDPPNTLYGIGYYEEILNRIVADFAEVFNEANMASNAIYPEHMKYQVALDKYNDYNTDYGTVNTVTGTATTGAWAAFATEWNLAAGVGVGAPGSFDNLVNTNGLAHFFNLDFSDPSLTGYPNPTNFTSGGNTFVILGPPPAEPVPSATLAKFYEHLQDYVDEVNAVLSAVPPGDPATVKPSAFLAQYFDYPNDTDLLDYALGTTVNLPVKQLLKRPLFESYDGGDMSAKNIKIAEGWKNGSYMLTTTKLLEVTKEDDVSGATENLEYMLTLFGKAFQFTTAGAYDPATGTQITGAKPPLTPPELLFKGGFEQMFRTIGLNAANDASSREKSLQANANVIMGIEDLRNALSSVSMDEEGVNLLRFQKSYAAAARVMTTLDEALEVLINRTGVVGR